MPLPKASQKALRNSRRKETRNFLQQRQLNEAIRRADAKSVNKAVSLIDKAVKNHLLHNIFDILQNLRTQRLAACLVVSFHSS